MRDQYPPKETILELQEIDLEIFKKSKTIEDYWNNAHQSKYSYWTSSNNTFLGIAKGLSIPKKLKGKSVLVIGPGGHGPELYGARELGAKVAGLDVSHVAREKFKNDFEMFSWENLKGQYQEIWMHLVAQHMTDEVLLYSLKKLKSHLTKDGVLRVQFAVPYSPKIFVRSNQFNSLDSCKSGANIRSFDQIGLLVKEVGFKLNRAQISSVYPEHKSAHLTLAISLKSAPIRHNYVQLRMNKFQKSNNLKVTSFPNYLRVEIRSLRVLLRKMKKLFGHQK
jgi:hypothetical protein